MPTLLTELAQINLANRAAAKQTKVTLIDLKKGEHLNEKDLLTFALGVALVLASGILLSNPPTVLAAVCTAKCTYGDNISVSGTQCSCQDNVGCTFTNSQGTFTQKCATKSGDEFELEDGGGNEGPPVN